MKNIFCILLFFCSNHLMAADIDAIIKKSRIKPDELSIYITSSAQPDNAFYKLNESKKRIPASLTKIITASAVLEKLPPAHSFETRLSALQKPSGEKLEGSLYLIGDGDPGFVSESMWNLVNNFVRTGIKEITGDIIVDDFKFDAVRVDASRDSGNANRAYDSPIGAMTFNWSAINVYTRPADKVGESALVFLDPSNSYFRLTNKVKTVAGSKKSIQVDLHPSTQEGVAEEVIVSGSIGVNADEDVIFRAVDKPDIWAGDNLKSFLERRGVTVKGKVRRASSASGKLVTLASVKSKPIGQHVSDTLKFSNNFVAEILCKNLAAEFVKKPATMEDGIQYLRKYLEQIGLKSFVLVNPSGLSRKNQFTAVQLQQILENMRSKIQLYPEFFAGLPIAGVDGTLKSRMKVLGPLANVRAKTGMLNGVAGLAGYINRDKDVLDIVIIYNGPDSKTYDARILIDKIVESLAN